MGKELRNFAAEKYIRDYCLASINILNEKTHRALLQDLVRTPSPQKIKEALNKYDLLREIDFKTGNHYTDEVIITNDAADRIRTFAALRLFSLSISSLKGFLDPQKQALKMLAQARRYSSNKRRSE
ncbi:hypothetical protein [Coxiella-like endosymbiont]|uniref:hypothetical protein n=1 Tax=Coxiella-like endosymbiont TaxID=1592897 RepID=UPI002729E158|nr:hypothetical protein [Coxiella-like endosymbiont]